MSQKPKGIDKLLKQMARGGRPDNEERKLRKRAAGQRRASRKKEKRQRIDVRDLEGDADDFAEFQKIGRSKSDSLDEWVKRIDTPGLESSTEHSTGQVVGLGPGWAWVELEDTRVECGLAREIAETQRASLAVGDRVWVDENAEPKPRVEGVQPRKSLLQRTDPGKKELRRAIVANVDLVVVVASVKTPPLHPKLFDRYLVAIVNGGAEPLLCINKIDLLESAEELDEVRELLAPYEELGIVVQYCSAQSEDGLDELTHHLEDRLCAFVGHSGVGKSSVLSAICPSESIDTGDVRWTDGKGRHTTTSSQLYELENGARVIDTPGIREFGLGALSPEELEAGFPEIAKLRASCRFNDCSHQQEPGCAVRAAVESGELHRSRFESWMRLSDNV